MRRQIKKWTLFLVGVVFLAVGFLLTVILNPTLTYTKKTTYNNFVIYHNENLDPQLTVALDDATNTLKTSEFYNSDLNLDICLNDGSIYPKIIEAIRGAAFSWGFYDKVVMQGKMNCRENFTELNGYKWNLTQLLAHEMTHCLQFDKLGFWKSNPIAKISDWKWEGYAEYISRQNASQKNLVKNIDRLEQDGTIAPIGYYNAWILVQYCLEIKQMTYQQLLDDQTSESDMKNEMMNWYKSKK
jgi:hypothetical protein